VYHKTRPVKTKDVGIFLCNLVMGASALLGLQELKREGGAAIIRSTRCRVLFWVCVLFGVPFFAFFAFAVKKLVFIDLYALALHTCDA
jgi:hypothetical protein